MSFKCGCNYSQKIDFLKKSTFMTLSALPTVSSSAAPPTSCLVQSLERPTKTRKLSSTSTTSRPSTAASKNTTSRSRSRSSSKERLLETLAGSENAPQTSHEEDEIEGTYSEHSVENSGFLCHSDFT